MKRGALVLLALLAAAQAWAARLVPAVVREQGRIRVALPRELLGDAEIKRGLRSGLTTSFVVTAESGEQRGGARIELRYELWDEVYLARAISFDGREEKATLPTLTALEQWWAVPHVTVLAADAGIVQLRLEVLPFSASEEADAKRWLAQSARASARPAGATGGETGAPSLLDAVIGTSVRRKPLMSYVWRLRVSP
jgi:hypothetical protein